MNDRRKNDAPYHLAGWMVFVVCALFFLASGLKNHDVFTVIGSILFLIACILFLIPLIRPSDRSKDTTKQGKGR